MKDKIIFSEIPNLSRYVVSNDGNLYRRTNGKLKQMTNNVNYNGYVCNYLIDDSGKRRYMQRGFVVLLAFYSDSHFDGAECDHISHVRSDNRLSNLRWLSHKDNCANRQFYGREKDRALYLIYDDDTVQYYENRKCTNIPSPTLSRILSGKHSQKYKCRGFYYDKLHAQSDDVKQKVRMSVADAICDNLFFKDCSGEMHKLFDF